MSLRIGPEVPRPLPGGAPRAYHVMLKPSGAACNLNCKYCFFLEKERLYPGSSFRMQPELMEEYIRQLLESHRGREVDIAWQGGEPTLMGLEFFERAVETARRLKRPWQTLRFAMQTNGTLIDARWAAFLKANDFLVGISIDGPQALHDAYRVNKGGAGTFHNVMRGWEILRAHGVETNVLCTVHAANAGKPLDVYRFFRDTLGANYIQFIPIVEKTAVPGQVSERSVKPRQYGKFLNRIFDEWARGDIGKVFVQAFDVALGAYVGQYSLCVHAPTCGTALALEHTGDLYSCDHFVEPDYRLGNIRETHLIEMVGSERQRQFGQDKLDGLPKVCRECPVRFACNGGCPKDRFITAPNGEPGLNYLCEGYKLFFTHIDPLMQKMAAAIRR